MGTLLPPGTIAGHGVPTITYPQGYEWAYLPWLAVANTFTVDFIARKKVSLNLTQSVLDSLPFPRVSDVNDPLVRSSAALVVGLQCTGDEMGEFRQEMVNLGVVSDAELSTHPDGILEERERLSAMARLEVIVARDCLGISRQELSTILDSFPVVEKRERKAYGEYLSKNLIMKTYSSRSVRS
jgi:hypothetical protein